jgi:ribonuclease PH
LSARAQTNITLSVVKDTSLNLRRDLIEEKELTIRQSLKQKIQIAIKDAPVLLHFSFSVVTDDGNLQSALLAGAQDLLAQAGYLACDVWSCLLMLYSDHTGDKWIIDPSFEEQNNLSNNLVLVTVFQSDGMQRILIDKGLDCLRTSYPVQQSSTLNFKENSLTLT